MEQQFKHQNEILKLIYEMHLKEENCRNIIRYLVYNGKLAIIMDEIKECIEYIKSDKID